MRKEMMNGKNAKRGIFLYAAVLGVVLLMVGSAFVQPAQAAVGWFDCSVNLVGPGNTQTLVNLTDLAAEPAFTSKWFLLVPARAKEMLAVLLTAINGNKQVVVVVDPESAPYPVIRELYLKAR
jgi:hypothetical protein